ncbi:MAG TPA: T9SS type A sorting domain-containing protein [Bacteroidales bacterium]|nr:T9SS type A sorting domain-containing protein [Bacteroidales bacterium]HPS16036.1 T9SS type A sorting domain-containing protein [Bacteroidales bacterium]
MIKKIIFTISFVFVATTLLQAQCDPDTTFTSPGVYPDTATNLPLCYATLPYSGVITTVVPVDTNSMPVDSMGVINVTGLPAGFSWATNTPSHFWHGGETGCFVISGTASNEQVGTYPLKIYVNAYVIGFLTRDTVLGYKIIIKDSASGVIDEFNIEDNISINIYNNPSGNSVTITVHSSYDLKNSFAIITDITGKECKRFDNLYGKEYILSKGGLSKGIYIFSIFDKEKIIAKKKIVIE